MDDENSTARSRPVSLRLGHRMIGVTQQRLRVRLRPVGDRHTDARRDPHRVATDCERILEAAEQPVGRRHGFGRRDHGADDHELVAVDPSDRVRRAEDIGKTLARRDEHVVATAVPIGVVDPPEVIEIAEQHRGTGRGRRASRAESGGESLGEGNAIGQARERVAPSAVGEGDFDPTPVEPAPPRQQEGDEPGGEHHEARGDEGRAGVDTQ